MKNFWLFLCIIIANFTFAQQYKSHQVAKGENVYRIAKRYNTTPEAIYKMNPGAKDKVSIGQILAIPIVDDFEYGTHVVAKGDTVYNIAKRYNTTTEAIYLLNPDAKIGINIGQVLRVGKTQKKQVIGAPASENSVQTEESSPVISADDKETVGINDPKIERFKTHKVKRKETIFSIAKKYKITVDDIKRFNKKLYSNPIKKKDKLRIPIYAKVKTEAITNSAVTSNNRLSSTTLYTIKANETKYGIARKHGITIKELEYLNPEMNPVFLVGSKIVVPTTIFVPYKDVMKSGFELYEIQPKETMFSLVRRLNISSEELLKLNPYIKDGLKVGMVITIPKQKEGESLEKTEAIEEGQVINLENKLFNYTPKKIALMLPFGIDTINANSMARTEDMLKKKKGVRVALDFYSGVLIALDSAKKKGITTELSVFDTQKNNNAAFIKNIISNNPFDEMQAVIGPLYQTNVETVASTLKKYDTPVFSPVSKKESKLSSNFFQARPTDEMLQDNIVEYVASNGVNKNIVLIIQPGKKHEVIKQKLIAKFPQAKVAQMQKGNFLYETHLNKVLSSSKPNWVFLESNDVALISNVIPLLNAKAESRKITLFTTDKNSAFDDDNIKNEYYSKVHLHYPSVNKELENPSNTSFIKKYVKKYGVEPNSYAIRGFDITYDILMRLGTADDLYHAATYKGTTEYVENKFNYTQKLLGGYYNKESYLIKYDENLKLTIVK